MTGQLLSVELTTTLESFHVMEDLQGSSTTQAAPVS